LQIICSELENKIIRKEIKPGTDEQIIIQPADYGGIDGLQNIAANFYDQQIAGMQRQLKLTKNETDAVKELIETGLIAGTRRVPMAYDAVVTRPGVKKEAIDLLVENKLLKKESHRSNSLLELSHDTLVAPVLKSGEQRLREKELKKRKKATLRILLGVLLLAIVALTLYIIYKNKSAKQARQDQYYYTAVMASQQNPTLAYKIALDGKSMGNKQAKLDTLISQFQRGNNGFITNRFQFNYPVSAAYFSPDNKTFTILGESKTEEWNVAKHRRVSTGSIDFFATCFINNGYHYIKWGADSMLLVNKEGSILAASPYQEANSVITNKDDELKFIIKQFETLISRAAKGSEETALINVSYGGGNLVHSKDSTMFFYENNCYLHKQREDSFYVFDIDQSSFIPLTSKTGEKNGFIKEASFVHDDETKRLKAMTATSDFRYFIYAADNSVKIIDAASMRSGKTATKELGKTIGEITYLSVSPNNSLILTTGKSNIARLWNVKGEQVATLQGHKTDISYASFSTVG
ncbi:MAG TPA: hypothetical protein VGB71_18905, partial [Flavisolibacter sp.]